MNRFGRLNLALILTLLLPVAASAQKDTRETREGAKFIALAMTKQDQTEKQALYEQAMTHLRTGMEQDAENARVWLLAGTALAGLGEMQEADAAFDRAQSMHPEYAEEIEQERLDAWISAFQAGVAAMDTDPARALEMFEGAEIVHAGRPEAQMYLGVLYANEMDDLAKAEQAFRNALEATEGPLFETLDEEGQQEWIGMRTSLRSNIERILMQRGVQDFQEQRFAEATEKFRTLTEMSPHSRDAWFNYGQALLAEAQQRDATVADLPEAEQAQAKQELIDTYTKLDEVTRKAQEYDPNNELLYMLLVRSHRIRGEYRGGEEALQEGQQAALRMLQELDALAVSVDDVNMIPGDESVQVVGALKNRKAAAGEEVRINFTLLDREGNAVGEQTITVTAPAPCPASSETCEQGSDVVQFEAVVPVTGEVAGWRYTVGG